MTIHNEEALQEFADLAKQGGKPLPYAVGPDPDIIKALEGEPIREWKPTITTTGDAPTTWRMTQIDFGQKRKFL